VDLGDGTATGPVDLLVNNAAVLGAREPFWEHDAEAWWHVFEVNVLGAYLCTVRWLRAEQGVA
jgi:NAD(P)-dependent dehydrogenase (short-subunit alcohol dehydrogenase family)